ncbi:MAG: PH domain-containing protein, partial [Clostridium sp.]
MDYNKQHWYYLVSKLFNIIKESVLGLIAFGIVAIKNASSIMLLIIILIGVLIITISVIGWLKEVYKIDNNAIHLKKGVFVVRDIVLPYNKVHSVDIASGVIQRIFKVCRIDIQSPGYNDHNSNITIIMSIQDAKQIKNNILGYTNQESESNESLIVKSDEVNYRATIKDILLCVITSSQITLGFSVILGIYLFLDQYIPKEYQDIAVNTSDLVFNRVFGESLFYKIMGMSMIILTLVIIISFVGTVIRYYDFTIKRESDKLKISYGLLSIKEITMPINRMLYIDIKEGLIQKPLGFCEVKIACIGYGNESGEKAILCPIIKRKDLPLLLKEVIPEISLDYNIDRVAKESLSMYIFISIWVWVLIS